MVRLVGFIEKVWPQLSRQSGKLCLCELTLEVTHGDWIWGARGNGMSEACFDRCRVGREDGSRVVYRDPEFFGWLRAETKDAARIAKPSRYATAALPSLKVRVLSFKGPVTWSRSSFTAQIGNLARVHKHRCRKPMVDDLDSRRKCRQGGDYGNSPCQ